MSYFTSILLGIVQGIAEFLPISSSGHLALFQNLFHIENYEASHMLFSVLLHLGTMVAVLVVYRRDIREMLLEVGRFIREIRDPVLREAAPAPKRRLLLLLVIATLPLAVAVLVSDLVEQLTQSTLAIGIALLITGLLLFLSDRHKRGQKTERNASVWDAVIVGVGQLFGIIPGISRSGITIATGLFCGFEREFAVRFSFLLSIPAILGANLLSLAKALGNGIDQSLMPVYLAGVLTAAVVGYFAIKLVQYVVRKDKFGGFTWYCWVVGGAAIVISFFI